MVSEEAPRSPESDITRMSFEETELTLGLPGEGRSSSAVMCSAKRGFVDTVVDLNVAAYKSGAGKPPPTKAQVVGWPPVRSSRKKAINESFKYVKVGMDGAPYLRKVNIQCYSNYQELFKDLEELFNCFTIGTNREESKLKGVLMKRMEYVPTYEDKDSDWMLVGDVPWKMYIESCKRIRLMKCSEADVLTLASKDSSSSSSSSTPKC